jgi:serine/threonine protein phosphatase PrpC
LRGGAVEVAVGSELGLWQRHQTDAYASDSIAPSVTFLGIADGFGSPGRGVSTAALALATVRDYLRRRHRLGAFGGRQSSPGNLRALLLSALDHANARLFAQSGSHEDFVGSGSSLTAVLVVGHHAFIGHVGDARACLLRLGRLEALTVDDVMFADAAVTSAKTSLPAKPRMRGVLWRSLGTQAKLEASIAHVELLAGDQLLLCTDGLHRCVEPEEFGESLLDADSASEAVARLLATARSRGNVDNGTLIVGRDLLVASSPDAAAAARFEGRIRTLIAIVLLLVAAVSAGVYVFRFGLFDRPSIVISSDRP